jgi:hypothetical protein
MQVDELLKPFPIKEFHPFPRAMLGPGAHEMIGRSGIPGTAPSAIGAGRR